LLGCQSLCKGIFLLLTTINLDNFDTLVAANVT
jgi:hypothetical protein